MFQPLSSAVVAQARCHDLARQQAEHLRQTAIDDACHDACDLWREADAALHHSLLSLQAQAERSARRWQARLARHRQTRATNATPNH